MRIKSCPVRIKAAGEHEGTDEGTFEAIVAAYNLDSVGDKITPGAFADTLADWKGRGDPIPVLWSHMSHDPEYHIGEVLEAEERPEGLWVKARIDTEPGSKAAQVYKLLKGRRVTQFSFAYDVEEGAWVDQKDGEGFYELRKLKLYEVGPTLIGANQATELLDVKSADGATMRIAVEGASAAQTEELRQALTGAVAAKAGRTLSAKNEERVRESGASPRSCWTPCLPARMTKRRPRRTRPRRPRRASPRPRKLRPARAPPRSVCSLTSTPWALRSPRLRTEESREQDR
jgi:HK97 family phage prohead protease